MPRIYATLAWGFEPEIWSAVGFSSETVRNNLQAKLRAEDGLVLTIGSMGSETPQALRGRLLGTQQLGAQAMATKDLVAPEKWSEHLQQNGGKPKWPFGLPVLSAERFELPPLRSDLLPRLHADNLHMKLASNFEELTADEAARVLALPRAPVTAVYASPKSAFAAHLTNFPRGPKPAPGTRTLSSASGPAATYGFKLEGTALATIAAELGINPGQKLICKVGFSKSPTRRCEELNEYLPVKGALRWSLLIEQWHSDEINAWAMEQEMFRQLQTRHAVHVKGEIFAADTATINSAWAAARTNTERPAGPVSVEADREDAILALTATHTQPRSRSGAR